MRTTVKRLKRFINEAIPPFIGRGYEWSPFDPEKREYRTSDGRATVRKVATRQWELVARDGRRFYLGRSPGFGTADRVIAREKLT